MGLFDDIGHAFEDGINKVKHEFDPNSNGILGKTKSGLDDAFKKGGVGNDILRKAGSIGNDIADGYDTAGNALLLGSAGAAALGQPELALPLATFGGALKVASPIVKVGSNKLGETADLIEAPKKDLGNNVKKLIFH